jgi:hypothetical protein
LNWRNDASFFCSAAGRESPVGEVLGAIGPVPGRGRCPAWRRAPAAEARWPGRRTELPTRSSALERLRRASRGPWRRPPRASAVPCRPAGAGRPRRASGTRRASDHRGGYRVACAGSRRRRRRPPASHRRPRGAGSRARGCRPRRSARRPAESSRAARRQDGAGGLGAQEGRRWAGKAYLAAAARVVGLARRASRRRRRVATLRQASAVVPRARRRAKRPARGRLAP